MSRGQVGGFIAGLLLGKYFISGNVDQRAKSKHHYDDPYNVDSKIVSLPTVDVRTHAEERAYQEGKNKYAWITNTLLIGALIANGAAALAGAWSAIENRRQAIAAESANRPWIQITKSSLIRLEVKSSSIEADIKFNLQNVGQAPARNTYIVADAGIPYFAETWEEEEDFCKKVGDGVDTEQHPFIIFPNQSTQKIGEVSVQFDKLGAYTKSVPLRIIGCIVYVGNDNALRHTSFDYTVTTEPDRRKIGQIENPAFAEDLNASVFVD